MDRWTAVPATLQEAIDYWNSVFTDKQKAEIKKKGNRDHEYNGLSHMGVRNNWGLWQDSPLALWFRERGIWHADDMSQVLSNAYWRSLNGAPVDDKWIYKQAAFYEKYWKDAGVTPETTEQMLERCKGYDLTQ